MNLCQILEILSFISLNEMSLVCLMLHPKQCSFLHMMTVLGRYLQPVDLTLNRPTSFLVNTKCCLDFLLLVIKQFQNSRRSFRFRLQFGAFLTIEGLNAMIWICFEVTDKMSKDQSSLFILPSTSCLFVT